MLPGESQIHDEPEMQHDASEVELPDVAPVDELGFIDMKLAAHANTERFRLAPAVTTLHQILRNLIKIREKWSDKNSTNCVFHRFEFLTWYRIEVIIRHPMNRYRQSCIAGKGDRSMFEQLDDPKLAGRKSWKERVTEGVVILLASGAVIGVLVYALVAIE